jgi:hypothetical protein
VQAARLFPYQPGDNRSNIEAMGLSSLAGSLRASE